MTSVSADTFAKAYGITPQAARLAFRNAALGKPWRGEVLPVIALDGNRGGNGGAVWGLLLDQCSPALREKLEAPTAALKAPVKPNFNGVVEDWQINGQRDRLSIIRPILDTPKGTAERAEQFRSVAKKLHVTRGNGRCLAESTLREWVRLFEDGGLANLLPSQRSDLGKRRVLVTREWDAGIDLPQESLHGIADRVVRDARSMIANNGTSVREVLRLSEANLANQCRDAGSLLPAARLRTLCHLNQKWAMRHDLDSYRMIYFRKKDHKTYQDKAVPRIRRDLHPMPLGLLIGDVHYVDILVQEGAEPVRVRLIAWMDAASLFVWVTPVFLSKGKGVRQEDVARSLAQVTMCPYGGIPQGYYLDNGSEYSALTDAMQRLSVLADHDFHVTLAKPYSPTSKGDIEGFFNTLEGIFMGLDGWIGGDRTNKKSANKGKVVAPYTRGLAQLEADIQDCVTIYNDRPQKPQGRLGGLSPKAMLEDKIKRTDFVARVPEESAFDLIFSRREVRTIRQGCVNVNGQQYHGDILDGMLPSSRVEVFVPLRSDCSYVFVRLASHEAPVQIHSLLAFEHGDREGAKVQGKLEAGVNRAVGNLSRDVDPTVSTFEHQKAAADKSEVFAPFPDAWTRAIDKTALPKSPEQYEEEEDARRREALAHLFPETTDTTSREASGGNR